MSINTSFNKLSLSKTIFSIKVNTFTPKQIFEHSVGCCLTSFFSLTLKQKKSSFPHHDVHFRMWGRGSAWTTQGRKDRWWGWDCYGSSEDMTESQLKSWVKLCQSHDYLRFIFYEQDVILSCLHSWETPRCSSSQKTEKTLLLQGTLNIIMLYPQFISKVKDMQSPTRHSCSF